VANRVVQRYATDNFKVDKAARKSAPNLCRVHKNGAQNLQVTRAEFLIFSADL